MLFVPQAGWNLLHTVTETTRLLRLATATSLSQFDRFQANLNTAHAGEAEVVPERVLTMVTLLDRYGIAHYGLSDGMAANNWVYQQMVASAWPRRLEPTAPDRFLLAGEPVPNGCRPIEQRSEVHLVRCP